MKKKIYKIVILEHYFFFNPNFTVKIKEKIKIITNKIFWIPITTNTLLYALKANDLSKLGTK
ncbi:hypothetical protein GCM10026987_22270 [Belliella aquatica]|uniref:Uncharacterized protein n=1 Tax=Belliella aquatica TaxID=1323734 RepID=A0ABQ1ML57_9BACT|nr:hypothetical protein GCM10010993_21240 [Belliella aquatica]